MLTTKKVVAIACALLAMVFCLVQIFSGRWILPQTFSFGPLTIHYYGLIMALAVAVGFYLAIVRAPKYGVDEKTAEDILFWLAIGGFIGARVYHVLSHFSYYKIYPLESFQVWRGGLSISGAVLGGLILIWVFKKLQPSRFPLPALLDWLTPSLLVGQIIGRFGNMFNYEAFGYPANVPWKMFVPPAFRPDGYQSFNFFHPWFLYEALGNAIILIFLMWFFGSRSRSPLSENQNLRASARDFAAAESSSDSKIFDGAGKLFFSYLLLYNALRFVLEFLRTDSTFIHGIRFNAVVSLLLAIIGIIGLAAVRQNHKSVNAQIP